MRRSEFEAVNFRTDNMPHGKSDPVPAQSICTPSSPSFAPDRFFLVMRLAKPLRPVNASAARRVNSGRQGSLQIFECTTYRE